MNVMFCQTEDIRLNPISKRELEITHILKLIDAAHQRGRDYVRMLDFVGAERCVKRSKELSRRLAELRNMEFEL